MQTKPCLRRACAEQAGLADYKRPIPLLMDKAEKSEKKNCSNGPQDAKSLEKTIQAQMVIFLSALCASTQGLRACAEPAQTEPSQHMPPCDERQPTNIRQYPTISVKTAQKLANIRCRTLLDPYRTLSDPVGPVGPVGLSDCRTVGR